MSQTKPVVQDSLKTASLAGKRPAWREGYEAASREQTFRDYCPYTFKRSGCMGRPFGQEQFDLEYRPKMDDWFAGWKAWLDEHGLGFNFQPKRRTPQERST